MKKYFLFFIAISVSLLFINISYANAQEEDENRGYIVKVGDKVPQFDIELVDGTKIPINELKGKVVMLQFTASWCPICINEMPFIESEIWQVLKDNKNFALYGIDLKENLQTVKAFPAKVPVTYPITLDTDGSKFGLFTSKGAGVTRNIIIDKKGKIVYLTRKFEREEFDEMVSVIKKELGLK